MMRSSSCEKPHIMKKKKSALLLGSCSLTGGYVAAFLVGLLSIDVAAAAGPTSGSVGASSRSTSSSSSRKARPSSRRPSPSRVRSTGTTGTRQAALGERGEGPQPDLVSRLATSFLGHLKKSTENFAQWVKGPGILHADHGKAFDSLARVTDQFHDQEWDLGLLMPLYDHIVKMSHDHGPFRALEVSYAHDQERLPFQTPAASGLWRWVRNTWERASQEGGRITEVPLFTAEQGHQLKKGSLEVVRTTHKLQADPRLLDAAPNTRTILLDNANQSAWEKFATSKESTFDLVYLRNIGCSCLSDGFGACKGSGKCSYMCGFAPANIDFCRHVPQLADQDSECFRKMLEAVMKLLKPGGHLVLAQAHKGAMDALNDLREGMSWSHQKESLEKQQTEKLQMENEQALRPFRELVARQSAAIREIVKPHVDKGVYIRGSITTGVSNLRKDKLSPGELLPQVLIAQKKTDPTLQSSPAVAEGAWQERIVSNSIFQGELTVFSA
ncbi:unnamed protein product [Amoebophrya sp. A120]|nr:unnamed protein product [Amoebophrya sp. A120]|eukprot:GSA120T00025994001.1